MNTKMVLKKSDQVRKTRRGSIKFSVYYCYVGYKQFDYHIDLESNKDKKGIIYPNQKQFMTSIGMWDATENLTGWDFSVLRRLNWRPNKVEQKQIKDKIKELNEYHRDGIINNYSI